MSTPVGHSRLQALQETQSSSVSAISSERQRVRAELAGHREPQRVGAAAGDIALVARDAVARAHDAARDFRQAPLLLHISTAPCSPPDAPGQADQSKAVSMSSTA